MPKLKRKSSRTSLQKKIKDALANESDATKLGAVYKEASRKLRRSKSIKDLHRKYLAALLPPLSSTDEGPINLRDCWIESTVRLGGTIKPKLMATLRAKSYLKTMIDQVTGSGMGKKKFVDLTAIKSISFTAEYLIFTFFPERISVEQQIAIAKVLVKNNSRCTRHDFLICANSNRLFAIQT
jgi:hypothetical protein